jgi:hypothetical protein
MRPAGDTQSRGGTAPQGHLLPELLSIITAYVLATPPPDPPKDTTDSMRAYEQTVQRYEQTVEI